MAKCGEAITCKRSAYPPSEVPGQVLGCPIGMACVPDVCNCGNAPEGEGICVSTEGCGDQGTNVMGSLVRIGEMEK